MRNWQTAFLLFVVVTVLACTGYVASSRAQPRTLMLVADRGETSAASRPYHAVVVFRAEDCDGRIDFMHAFARPHWRLSFSTGAVVIGGPAEAKSAAQLLRARGLSMPVSAVRSRAHPGSFLGYTSTPYLLVLDRQNRLRIAVPGPSSASDMRALERAAEALLDPAPQPR
jgi:hypothetical protein